MENPNALSLLLVSGVLLVSPMFASAYSDETTHPALTSETVKLFNEHNPDRAFTESEARLIMRGSTDEDANTRPLQHFYDPVHQTGLVIGGAEFRSAPEWALDTKTQAAYAGNLARVPGIEHLYGTVNKTYSADTDHSWERAIYEYAWGDKERALKTLGHILHLAQDMSVPAHTRNDPHPHSFAGIEAYGGPSPYEGWTAQFAPENIVVEDAIAANMPEYGSLEGYLEGVAEYSNANFFSKDSTESIRYSGPERGYVSKKEIKPGVVLEYSIGRTADGDHLLSVQSPDFSWKDSTEETIDDNSILSDYWDLLSKQAVLHGAGIIELFFEKVEEERETKELALKNRDWADKIYDATAGVIYDFVGDTYGTSVPYEELNTRGAESVERDTGERVYGSDEEDNESQESLEQHAAVQVTEAGEREPTTPESEIDETEEKEPQEQEEPDEVNVEPGAEDEQVDERENETIAANPRIPGGGGGSSSGGGGGNANSEDESSTEPADTTPPPMPEIDGSFSSTSPQVIVGTTTAMFTGTAEATSTIEAVYNPTATTTADTNGDWELAFPNLPQGTTTITFTAMDAAGNRSTSTEATVFVDSQAPPVSAEIEECASSVAESGCLAATTTVHVSWDTTEPADDFSHFVIDVGGTVSTTTATSTVATTTDFTDFSFGVSARDTHGNASATTTATAHTATRPVVINEVAWMGTEASFNDEWIELHNPTEHDIKLDGWRLYSEDEMPDISLASKTIPAGGYYLLERGEDDLSVGSTTADQLYTGALDNGSDALTLVRPTGVGTSTAPVDVAPADGNGNYKWCGGSNTSKRTMERIDPLHAGSDCDNWASANDHLKNGVDADGDALTGTPKAKNSAAYEVDNHFRLSDTVTLTADRSPYLVDSTLEVGGELRDNDGNVIQPKQTLEIEPGVVIKIAKYERINVLGALKARGTADEPVVFTAFSDDEYGGDMNGDGVCEPDNASSTAACPSAGDWEKIAIRETSEGSVFEHTIVRYGGRYYTPADDKERSMVAVERAAVDFKNVVVENAQQHGLYLSGATSTVRDSVFRNNWNRNDWTSGDGAGIYAEDGGDLTIANNTFADNDYGVQIRTAAVAEDNTFTDNNIIAADIYAPGATYRGNTGSGNTKNAIRFFSDALTETGATTTLAANDIAYLLRSDMDVAASSTLAFESGVVIKNEYSGWEKADITVHDNGKIYHNGSSADDVIFTSRHDDSVGGQTDAATSTEPSAGDWYGIRVREGGTFDVSGFTVRYAGDERGTDKVGGISLGDGAATSTIANAVIEKNMQFGITMPDRAAMVVNDTVIRDHDTEEGGEGEVAGLYVGSGSTADMNGVDFSGNDPWDIRAEDGAAVSCTNCTISTTTPADLLD